MAKNCMAAKGYVQPFDAAQTLPLDGPPSSRPCPSTKLVIAAKNVRFWSTAVVPAIAFSGLANGLLSVGNGL